MKRGPLVIGSTAVGLGLVLSFHTHAPKLTSLATGTTGTTGAPGSGSGPLSSSSPVSPGATTSAPPPTATTTTATTTTAPAAGAPSTAGPGTTPDSAVPTTPATAVVPTTARTASPVTAPPTTAPPTTPATVAERSATSPDVQYRYGDLELQVVERGSRIEQINVIRDGASDIRSEEINSQALPQLQQQAMTAQSANIDGVSGATFTSDAYVQALQSALDQLGGQG